VEHRRILALSPALVPLLATLFVPPVEAAHPPILSLVSVALDGDEAPGASFSPSISADGRYVAFASQAPTLVPGDTNELEDVFVHERATGRTTRVSLGPLGLQGDGDSFSPSVSADGRYVAFASFASTLVSGDTNDELDVFVHDRSTGRTSRVSVSSAGAQSNGPSSAPSISADGALVAFESSATTLVPGDANRTEDVFVHEVATRRTTRVSVGLGGAEAESPSFGAELSGNGRYVAFESFAATLVPGDGNGLLDVFVRDLVAGATTRVSVGPGGAESDDRSFSPSISDDGRYVAFSSFAATLVPGDTNRLLDVFVHDRSTGETTQASVGAGGTPADGLSFTPALSADGRLVAFPSEATNLVPSDANGVRDVFLFDLATSRTTRLSVASTEGNGPSLSPSISATGTFVTFGSFAANLVAGDSNGLPDVFVARH
jgi:Tol biopolymer transport system component